MKITTLLLKIIERLKSITSHPIEEGWATPYVCYKKWSDGFAEAWGHYEGNFTPYADAPISGWKSFTDYLTITGIFIATPQKIGSAQMGNGGTLVSTGGLNDTKDRISLHWFSNVQSGSGYWQVYMWGRWK